MRKSPTTSKSRKDAQKHAGGRPPIPEGEHKSQWVRMRVTVEERDQLTAAAKREHLQMSAWLRRVALLAAEAGEKKKT